MAGSERRRLRQHFRQLRRNLSTEQQATAANKISENLFGLFPQTPARPLNVAVYFANDGEIDLTHFVDNCWQGTALTTVLPILHPFTAGHLVFQQYTRATPMTTNRFGIPEPRLNCTELVPLAQLDAILMPLVAFDRHKNRLGMGGGFFDRTLSAISQQPHKPKLIGIAHTCQCHETELPIEKWDIPLDNVATPDYVI